eukprot:TRINITY_DN13252_c0_g1_i1.p1 TRINITY_DN13252_c0_g1~~TRINITY_DN13252_c0_g1_i1.p1  ORF type:complete len:229 (-),score=63.89 TRINITY_DN13252_c0_g1_i1:45-731(-)
MEKIFGDISKQLNEESTLREEIKTVLHEMTATLRSASAQLQQIHGSIKNTQSVCDQTKKALVPLKDQFAKLQQHINADNYYKFIQLWKNDLQQIVFMLAFLTWLESKRLIDLQEIEQFLGLPGKSQGVNAFALELEDYLVGLTYLPNELSRLAINSVIAEEFTLPGQISQFISDLYAGYRLLNLKNDFLRKRMDSIKYDVKKVEEVVYDVALRGLSKNNAQQPTSNTQ